MSWTEDDDVVQEYADDENLSARQSIYHHVFEAFDTFGLLCTHTAGADRIVDVGCGNGLWTSLVASAQPDTTCVGIDFSAGMLQAVPLIENAGGLAAGDVRHLPIADGMSDVTLALWMLYHLDDVPGALRELERITASGGRVLTITNADGHMAELHDALDDALVELGVARPAWDRLLGEFSEHNAPDAMQAVFGNVEIVEMAGRLLIPEVPPCLGYLQSLENALPILGVDKLPADMWEATERQLNRRLENGPIEVLTANLALISTI